MSVIKKDNTLSIVLSLDPEEYKKHEPAALEELGKEVDLPGFRRGKVPADVLRNHLKPEALFSKTAEIAAGHAAAKALAPHADRILGAPRIKIAKVAPGQMLEVTIEVDLTPEVDLQGWRTVRVQTSTLPVADQEIDDSLEWLRKSRAKFRAILRPAQKGDFIEIDFSVSQDEKEISRAGSERYPLVLGEAKLIPGFEEQMVGMQQGEERTFTLAVPPDWPGKDIAGKNATFKVKLAVLQERLLPELSDDFAQTLGGFEDLVALRASVKEGIEREHEAREKKRVSAEALKLLSSRVRGKIPPSLLAQEQEALFREFAHAIEAGGLPFGDWLSRVGKDPDEFKKELQAPAEERAKAALVLRAIAKHEGIEPTEDEIKEEITRLLKELGDGKVDPTAMHDYARVKVRNEKTLNTIYGVVIQQKYF